MTRPAQDLKPLVSLIEATARRHDAWQVFRDFVAMAAISISNAVDASHREEREEEYLGIVRRYDREEIDRFPRMLAELTLALEGEASDVLGRVFCELELGNKWAGQFFTPDSVCRLMAAMSFSEDTKAIIQERGFVRVCEPAVGGGAMVIGLCNELRAQGINYQRHLHVTAVDIDIRAVHMAYVQLSLLHVPAVIVHGDTLRLQETSHWYTPAHILGGWTQKLRHLEESESPLHVPAISTAHEGSAQQPDLFSQTK